MTALMKVQNGSTLPSLSNWMDEWFNRDFNSLLSPNNWYMPRVNIKETDEHFMLELAAPGMAKSDFDIELDNGFLTISSEIKHEDKDEQEHYTKREFYHQAFKRSFSLPDSVNMDKVSAEYRDGILFVNLPKKEEAKRKPTKLIQIK